jgi:hypothetical protein
MTRKAISIIDNGGYYQIEPGAAAAPWTETRELIEYEYPMDPSDIEVGTEPLMGWGRWTWAVLIDGNAVCFVDGDEPTDLPFGATAA